MKPIIGITTKFFDEKFISLHRVNFEQVIEAGGVPVALPLTSDQDTIDSYVEMVDGLILTGGADVSPLHFGEEPHPNLGTISPSRDDFEMKLLKTALDKKVPLFTICRGTQMLNVASGGTIYQDMTAQIDKDLIQHRQEAIREYLAHHVNIEKDSELAEIFGEDRVRVNTFHHQAIRDVGNGLKAVAHADDGIIEAVESTSDHYMLGVQWHPEYLSDDGSKNLYKTFIDACKNK